MTTPTHTAAEGLAGRLADMRAILALSRAQDTDDLTADDAARLNGLGMSDTDTNDLADVAYSLADSYCYGAHTLYRMDDDRDARYVISRVELLLAGGGPTHVLTWDERGGGWSDYSDSWAVPDTATLTSDDHEMVADFLRAFIVSELD